MRVKQLSLFALLALSLASLSLGTGACGGSQPAIKHRMSMDVLAPTPPEERAPVADAYRSHYQAQLKLDHMNFLLSDIDYELKIARAEKAQRKQSQKVAKLEGKRNAAVFRTGLATAADKLLNGMKKEERAQGERISYLKAQRTYLRREVAHSKLALIQAEAAFELAKAKLAKQRDTVPKGFTLDKYIAQEKRAKDKAQAKAQKAKAAQAKAKVKEQAWKKSSK